MMGNKKKFSGVLYLPEFKYNLIYVAKLTNDLSCSITFYPNHVIMQDLSSGVVLGIGKEAVGLYIFLNPLLSLVLGSMPYP